MQSEHWLHQASIARELAEGIVLIGGRRQGTEEHTRELGTFTESVFGIGQYRYREQVHGEHDVDVGELNCMYGIMSMISM